MRLRKECPEGGSKRPARAFGCENFKITKFARDKTYGYSEDNPVKVGGGMEGPLNEQRF